MEKLDKVKNDVGVIKPFVGQKDLLIVGTGSVVIEKSLDKGENFYKMTDASGDIVHLHSDEGIVYNGKLENLNGVVQYRVRVTDGSVNYMVV